MLFRVNIRELQTFKKTARFFGPPCISKEIWNTSSTLCSHSSREGDNFQLIMQTDPIAYNTGDAVLLQLHCVPKKRPPFYFSNNSSKN